MEQVVIDNGEYPNCVPTEVLVSVYMITYNHESYIAQAIESVLMQRTEFPIELCIGEDRSTDETRKICISYAQRFPDKIRLFLRTEVEKKEGSKYPPGRWNGYLTRRSCRGKFIAILEGDDFWIDPYKLQRQVNYLTENSECPLCATRALVWSTSEDKQSHINPSVHLKTFAMKTFFTFGGCCVNTCTMMYRREVVPDPMQWGSSLQAGDWSLVATALMSGKWVIVLPIVSAIYRVHNGGVWQGRTITVEAAWEERERMVRALLTVAQPDIRKLVASELKWREYMHGLYARKGWRRVAFGLRRACCARSVLVKLTEVIVAKSMIWVGQKVDGLMPLPVRLRVWRGLQ